MVVAKFPPVRELFLPDPGYMIADIDLDRADAQVVAWEAGDEMLKQVFREKLDLHMENAKMIFGERAGKKERQLAKVFCHAANYGASPKTLARHIGITIAEAETIHRRWFTAHPAIADWHSRVEREVMTTRRIRNAFGNQRLYLTRVDGGLLGQALAWVPQSTVGLVINRIWKNLFHALPEVHVLMQVHDSLVIQFPQSAYPDILSRIYPLTQITIPYPDPLIIPTGIKVSKKSWGDCKSVEWRN